MTGFTLAYEGFDPRQEGVREALTSTGNGLFCTRGCAEWEDAGDVHYPGTYAHGVYNRETTIMGGTPVPNEDLVNLPNWLVLKLRIDGEEVLALDDAEVLGYRHEYDLRSAVVSRTLRVRDRSGRTSTLESRRFVSMAHAHQAGIEWSLTPEDWAGRVEVISALDGRISNRGVARYRPLEGRHLEPVLPRTFGPEVIGLMLRTRQSRTYVAQAARTRVFDDGRRIEGERSLYQLEDYVQQVIAVDVAPGAPLRVEKMVALYTSHDHAISEPLGNAGKSVLDYPGFDEALADHRAAWEELWEACDLHLPGDDRAQMLLRLHIAHVLQVCSPHTPELDAGVPARGLNGEAYRGHVFWDELYVFPFLNFRLPRVSRHLLMYRARRLGEARRAARAAGLRGAMYPWQSGSDGQEETQVVHLNPLSGRWEPDFSHNQRHVGAAIFHNVWHYFQATADTEFMRDHGAEMMLEITRFWASLAHRSPDRDRYEIHGVMGPDEFHDGHIEGVEGGLRNNAYTNVMVAWICATAPAVLELLPARRAKALRRRIDLSDEEIALWDDMSRRMLVPFHDGGIISQFEGYELLADLDWDRYRERYGDAVRRLDRILGAEGDDPDRYKVAKQADTVMLFFLFSSEELGRLLGRLGYRFTAEDARRNIDYYDARTTHGSTLSFVTHAGALAALDPESSWSRFLIALESDIGDLQGGTTGEGIHMGVMSGTLDLVQRGYLGTAIRGDVLHFAPRLTGRLEGLELAMQFRGTPIRVALAGGRLTVSLPAEGAGGPIWIAVGGQTRELHPGETHRFPRS